MSKAGQEILRRRIEKRWSQKFLAYVLDIHENSVILYETGKQDPSIHVIQKLVYVLGGNYEDYIEDFVPNDNLIYRLEVGKQRTEKLNERPLNKRLKTPDSVL